jgi:hypothetical protein
MAHTALKEPNVDLGARAKSEERERQESRERLVRESAERYRRSVNEVNRTRDSDIEKALRS